MKGSLAKYLPRTKKTLRALYDSEYQAKAHIEEEASTEEVGDCFDVFMEGVLPSTITDEYKEYTEAPCTVVMPSNIFD
jgi:hypothetical protein